MRVWKEFNDGMRHYRYGRFNLIKNCFEFYKNIYGKVLIKNFYSGDKFREGDCLKLTNDFYKENLGHKLVKVLGNEPTYFSSNGDNHIYSIYTEKVLPNDFWNRTFCEKKEIIQNSIPYVIDPSFKLIVPFHDSGYTFKKFFQSSDFPSFLELKDENVPLGINRDQNLISIGVEKENWWIGLQKPFRKNNHEVIPLENIKELRRVFLMDDDLQSICVNLSKKYIDFKS